MAVLFMSPSFDIGGTASRPYQPLVAGRIPDRLLCSPDCENARERSVGLGDEFEEEVGEESGRL
jgi:hypothetical protein